MNNVQDPEQQRQRLLYPRVTSFRSRRAALTAAGQRAWDTMWPTLGREVDGALLDTTTWFGRDAELILEIGCGTGTSTAAMAAAEPEHDVIAVEVYVPGIAQLLGAAQREELTNVRVIRGDGVAVLEDMIAPGSLTGVRVYFPDPWPKARHHKRRLLQSPTLALMASRLKNGGILHIATDHADYAQSIAEVVTSDEIAGAFRRLPIGTPDDIAQGLGRDLPISLRRPVTKFQGKADLVGRPIHEFVLERYA